MFAETYDIVITEKFWETSKEQCAACASDNYGLNCLLSVVALQLPDIVAAFTGCESMVLRDKSGATWSYKVDVNGQAWIRAFDHHRTFPDYLDPAVHLTKVYILEIK